MAFDWKKLIKVLPIVAQAASPEAGAAAEMIVEEAEKILAEKKAADPSFDRDAYLAEAQTQWDRNVTAAEGLLAAGHETE